MSCLAYAPLDHDGVEGLVVANTCARNHVVFAGVVHVECGHYELAISLHQPSLRLVGH